MFPKKQPSGYEKRKKRQRIEQLTQSQKGALEKFFLKKAESGYSLENQVEGLANESQHPTPHLTCQHNDHDVNGYENLVYKIENDENQLNDDDAIDMNENENVGNEIEQPIPHLDSYDPSNWVNLDNEMIVLLVESGPIR